jgi:hyperosmotically inducible protein
MQRDSTMKPFVATLLATALTAAFASSAYAADANDPATYRTMTQKAAADYKSAAAQCTSMTGNARTVCVEEAKVTRARAEVDAIAQYNNTLKARTKARTALADAEYALAKAKCADSSGAGKDACITGARTAHTAALADAKADRDVRVATATDGVAPITSTDTRDATKAAAVDKCAQIDGKPTTGCLIDNKGTASTAAAATATTAGAMVNRTEQAAETAVDKTKDAARTVAAKTEKAVDTMAAKTDNAAEKTGAVVADSVITTKVKADIFKEPELKSMAIHVETEKGVVMLSGFVDSKADAEKAVRLARSVNGVTQVKSAIKVK